MSFGETWRNAASEEIKPSAGNYKVEITGGSAFTSQKGDDYAKVTLKILEHPEGATNEDEDSQSHGELIKAGQMFEHFMGFKNETAARINREALLTYGLRDPESIRSIEDLSVRINELTGTVADVGVKWKDSFLNIDVYGSRPAQPVSDIPSDTDVQEARASFAAAAGKDDDVSWLS